MDSHYDLYGSEQVSVSPPTFFGDVAKPRVQPGVTQGYYEDQLTLEQQGLPSRLRGASCNPYIQDPLSKSQRHNPIRVGSVEDRSAHIAHSSCMPGLANMYGGQACGYARDQGLVYVAPGEQCPGIAGVGRVSTRDCDQYKKPGMQIDSNLLLWIFLIVVMVYLVVNNLAMFNSLRPMFGMQPLNPYGQMFQNNPLYEGRPRV